MKGLAVIAIVFGFAGLSVCLPAQQDGVGADDGDAPPQASQPPQTANNRSDQAPSQSQKTPAPTGRVEEIRLIAQRPDNVAEYLQSIRRPGLRMTVDTVDEGFKRKNVNTFDDGQIKIKDKNSTEFSRNGQVQNFQGPNFNLRTAVLLENTQDGSKTHVTTAQDSEKNFTRKNDRVTQFVGTLDTDTFSAGALLTDHSNNRLMGSVRQTNDGTRESRLSKQNTSSISRGSFLKAGNLTINSRFQSDSFSNRERTESNIPLGDGSSSPDDGSSSAADGAQDEQ